MKFCARLSKKRIGSIVPAVSFKIRVRDDSIEGPNPYRWDDLTSYDYRDWETDRKSVV